ncbi:phage tail fiber domain-containing protein [Pseudomonas rhodesiae]|uniref:phage tail fiber domain-containing protein n=1 Tax=Pseudomonas rhodesiae TaxID=76760 RepID=UPI001EED97B3|nr:phage tail fiber protein [Pseudomonas rhodesiae]
MAAPKTVLTYPLNGAQKDFTIPFEYLARKFVVVTLIGNTRRVLILNSDYRFTARTAITTTKAWGPGDVFTSIELRRVTSATERLVDFADGSILRAYDLNTSQVQSLHIAEEARDLTADTIGVNNDGDLDARGRKIVNVADGVLDGDSVNMGQTRRWSESALNQANRSEAQANRSESMANAAQTQANKAEVMANESARHATNSSNSATASENSRVASANAMTTSIANANLSKAYAVTAEDVLVQPGLYSSLHYSRKSENSAVRSYQDSLTSGAQADRATKQADRAKSEADKLGNSNGLMEVIDVSGISQGGTRYKPNMAVVVQEAEFFKSIGGKLYKAITTYDIPVANIVAGRTPGTAPSTSGASEIAWFGDYASLPANIGIYTGALTIREKNMATGGDNPSAPSITFHWGGRNVKQLWMNTGGGLMWGSSYDVPNSRSVATHDSAGRLTLGGSSYIQTDGVIVSPAFIGGDLYTELNVFRNYRKRYYMKREVIWTGVNGTAGQVCNLSRPLEDGEALYFLYPNYPYEGNACFIRRGARNVHSFGGSGTTVFDVSADGRTLTPVVFTNTYAFTQLTAGYYEIT